MKASVLFIAALPVVLAAPVPEGVADKAQPEVRGYSSYGSYKGAGTDSAGASSYSSYGNYAGDDKASTYSSYGSYKGAGTEAAPPAPAPAPAGGYGSYGSYAGAGSGSAPAADEGGYGSYGSYPAPAGGYGSYGAYKRVVDWVKGLFGSAENQQ